MWEGLLRSGCSPSPPRPGSLRAEDKHHPGFVLSSTELPKLWLMENLLLPPDQLLLLALPTTTTTTSIGFISVVSQFSVT